MDIHVEHMRIRALKVPGLEGVYLADWANWVSITDEGVTKVHHHEPKYDVQLDRWRCDTSLYTIIGKIANYEDGPELHWIDKISMVTVNYTHNKETTNER